MNSHYCSLQPNRNSISFISWNHRLQQISEFVNENNIASSDRTGGCRFIQLFNPLLNNRWLWLVKWSDDHFIMFESVISDLELMVCESNDKQSDWLLALLEYLFHYHWCQYSISIFSQPSALFSTFNRDCFPLGVFNVDVIILFFRIPNSGRQVVFFVFIFVR